jgi:tetratricopeptide (TPR) repeat protein
MKKIALIIILSIFISFQFVSAQTNTDYSKIDILLIRGDYKKVIDTCQQLIASDSLNSEIYYKMGLAYQNLISDDKSLDCFLKASAISNRNNTYNFMVAKGYYNRGKTNLARPILLNLCSTDSMNWVYAYYLTSILIQDGKFDESIKIYNRFYNQDSTNYSLIDKIGFAYLRKGDFEKGIEYFSRSLAIKNNNISAIKNIAYLYAMTYKIDTAIVLLSKGIDIDPADMDLYARRAAFYYSKNYTKRALNDYLKLLNTGDSSVLYLKRAGIGYANNLQPKEAIPFLLKAYVKDSSDYEVSSFLARSYEKLKDYKNSAYYYRHVIKTLNPITQQVYFSCYMLAEVLKSDGKYEEAVTYYLQGQKYGSDPNTTMIIANIYDEKLNNVPKAIFYYELYLKNIKATKPNTGPEYTEKIRKRLEYLKNPATANK